MIIKKVYLKNNYFLVAKLVVQEQNAQSRRHATQRVHSHVVVVVRILKVCLIHQPSSIHDPQILLLLSVAEANKIILKLIIIISA